MSRCHPRALLVVFSSVVVACATACATTSPAETSPSMPSSETSNTDTATTNSAVTAETVAVEFPTAGLTLEGTLHLPDGIDQAPAVVLVHGSGPNSRDQAVPGQLNMAFGFSIPVFAQLAQGLAQHGFAVLRYDKRTCGPFNGLCKNAYPKPADDITIDAFVDDANAAVEFLSTHPRIDATRIFVVGHSQGATLVPTVLTRSPKLHGGVMIAGNYDPIDAIMARQLAFSRELLASQGLTPEQIDAIPQIAALADTVARLAALRAGTHDGSPIGGATAAFWQSYFRQNEQAVLEAAALDRPLFAMRGSYDWNIEHDQWQQWHDTLRASPHAIKHDARELECITHALNCVHQPDWTKIQPSDIEAEVSREVVDAIVGFLERGQVQ